MAKNGSGSRPRTAATSGSTSNWSSRTASCSGMPSCGAARPTPGALCMTLRMRSISWPSSASFSWPSKGAASCRSTGCPAWTMAGEHPGGQDLLDGFVDAGGAEVSRLGVRRHANRLLASASRCNKVVDASAKHRAGVDLQDAVPSAGGHPERQQRSHLVVGNGVRIAAGGPDPQPEVLGGPAGADRDGARPGGGRVFADQGGPVDPVDASGFPLNRDARHRGCSAG